jgi:uncharacterized membrane protein YkvA (DUF1232 family)
MPLNLARLRTLVFDVPRNAKLAYCLLRDDRVPSMPKLALTGALALVVSPLDLPAWIPVIGELDALALALLAVKVFIRACPESLVREHQAAIKRGDSILDRDLRQLFEVLRYQAANATRQFLERRRRAAAARPPRVVVEDEPA